MRIKKIKDKLEFDVEAQALPCKEDCAYLEWSSDTSELFWADPYFRLKCKAKLKYNATGNIFW